MADRNTSIKRWLNSATEESWNQLITDYNNMAYSADGKKEFQEKYTFSTAGIKAYLEQHQFEMKLRAEYSEQLKAKDEEIKALQQELEELRKNPPTAKMTLAIRKRSTDYRKVSLTLSDDAAELLKQTVDEYESMGLDRKYCTSELIRIVCEAVKPNE